MPRSAFNVLQVCMYHAVYTATHIASAQHKDVRGGQEGRLRAGDADRPPRDSKATRRQAHFADD
eukprot:6196830-Pleurochrysis_carterae.AAC.8